jgi:hypothetical protein
LIAKGGKDHNFEYDLKQRPGSDETQGLSQDGTGRAQKEEDKLKRKQK